MFDVQFIVDERGNKTAVVIDLKKNADLWEDFYDRALAGIRGRIPVIGLAFHSQIVADIPAEEHDVSVDLLITEERCYFADGGLGARLATQS